jgi:hypothetical protein
VLRDHHTLWSPREYRALDRFHPGWWPTVDEVNEVNQAGRWAGVLGILRDRTSGVSFSALRHTWRIEDQGIYGGEKKRLVKRNVRPAYVRDLLQSAMRHLNRGDVDAATREAIGVLAEKSLAFRVDPDDNGVEAE